MRWQLARFPSIWGKVGVRPIPYLASEVTPAHVRILRDSPAYAPKTRSQYLQTLRNYLRWEKQPLAEEKAHWVIDAKPTPGGRRWLERTQMNALWGACRDEYDRLIVAAEGWNGLRRIEILRMYKRDLSLVLPKPTMTVHGKGRHGGKDRSIPMSGRLYGVLVGLCDGKAGDERIYPFGRSDVDRRLEELRRLAEIPVKVSSHDLRRSFGRIGYYGGVKLVDLQRIMGHESPEETAGYIGVDLNEMADGLSQFEAVMADPPGV